MTFKRSYEKSLLKQKQNVDIEEKKWQFKNYCMLTVDDKVKFKPTEMFIIITNNLKESL